MQITLTKIEDKQLLKTIMLGYFKEVDQSKLSINNFKELNYPYFDLY